MQNNEKKNEKKSRNTVVSYAKFTLARDGPYIFMRDQKLRRAEIIRSQ